MSYIFTLNRVRNENCGFPHFVGVVGCDTGGKPVRKVVEKAKF